MTDFQQFAVNFLFVWVVLCSFVFAYELYDVRQRLQFLQDTIEEFINDVQV